MQDLHIGLGIRPPRCTSHRLWLVLAALIGPLSALAADLRINEFMAANKSGLRDEDGNTSDWIELHNSGQDTVDLAGWFLTDTAAQPAKWRFPSLPLPANAYLVVWASGLDRTNAGAPLHANFKLSKAGNYLALVWPDGHTVASAFAPTYPPQQADVSYGCDQQDPARIGYCASPTPGGPNAPIGLGFAPPVQFSEPSKTFQSPFTVTLSLAGSNAVIRYFLVTNAVSAALTNVPNGQSPVYSGPIPINRPTIVRARAFPDDTNYFPGPPHSEAYLQLGSDAARFTSTLPIVLFHNFGAGDVPVRPDQFAAMQVFEPHNGLSSMTNSPDLACRTVYHRHGSSTLYDPKPNLRLQSEDEAGANHNVRLVELPAENDWIFYGVDVFDKSALHNPLVHELYREMGHYTARTRFVEVFIKRSTGTPTAVTSADYGGLYVVEESIKVGKSRVAIDKLQSANTNTPSVTGGYLLSIDRQKTDDHGSPIPQFYAAGVAMNYLDPDYFEISAPERAPQRLYLENYFGEFYSALSGSAWRDPVKGYAPYLDLDSWIDYHLHQTFVFAVDMLRLSAYFYKPRTGPLVQGPLWDFDRSFGTGGGGDYRGFNPRRWRSGNSDGGTDPFNAANTFNNPWYGRLFQDPDFFQKWIDRYQSLRLSVYSLSNLTAQVDILADQIKAAAPRDAARWSGSGQSDTSPRAGRITGDGYAYTFPTPGTFAGEVAFVKVWFTNRVQFMDTNFLSPPQFSVPAGAVTRGTALTITAATRETNSTVYYTLDGSDPRLPGGAVSPAALGALITVGLSLTNNVRVFARNLNPAHRNLTGLNNPPLSSPWSGPSVADFRLVPAFDSITSLPDGRLQLSITSQAGAHCYLESSPDLATWTPLADFVNTNGLFEFTTSAVSNGADRFYRIRQ